MTKYIITMKKEEIKERLQGSEKQIKWAKDIIDGLMAGTREKEVFGVRVFKYIESHRQIAEILATFALCEDSAKDFIDTRDDMDRQREWLKDAMSEKMSADFFEKVRSYAPIEWMQVGEEGAKTLRQKVESLYPDTKERKSFKKDHPAYDLIMKGFSPFDEDEEDSFYMVSEEEYAEAVDFLHTYVKG